MEEDRCPVCGTLDAPRRVVRDTAGGGETTLDEDVMERIIGRPLNPGERVHFRDGDSRNCTRANLVLCSPPPRRYYRGPVTGD